MKRFFLLISLTFFTASAGFCQFFFDVEIDTAWTPTEVVMPASPLKKQIIFIGGTDIVQTTATYGNEAGQALAKEWHDFIGFTEDTTSDDLGWVSVNHEMVQANDSIGDGGGMTVFKIRRAPVTDELEVVEQTLSDGRTGKFFNVDFVNTVGETGMNCGGIVGPTGRIWTAEEWFRSGNSSLGDTRDTADWTIDTDIVGDFNGQSIKKYENFNYMVEIDPREAKAVRKQYNWGRQPFEGGAVMPDNKTVYTGADATPGLFTKFVADVAGDFTKGKTYVYKHDNAGDPWVEMDNESLEEMLNFTEEALAKGATMFNRLEWVATDGEKVYITETGRDGIGSRFENGAALGGVLDYHWLKPVRMRHPAMVDKPDDQVIDFVMKGGFNDYYGRVIEFDPATGKVETYLEGGPYFEESPEAGVYPFKHLSNPDGLSVFTLQGKKYMIINEDLNGTSNGRVPAGVSNRTCELYLLPMSIENPTTEDLTRISIVPVGAEVTGAIMTSDGKTMLVNSQHPSDENPFPYNHSLTYAITGWDGAITALEEEDSFVSEADGFSIFPNPVSQTLEFNTVIDAAIYTSNGKRLKVIRNVKSMDVSDLAAGLYIIKAKLQNQEGTKSLKFIKK
ncbi:alkaline phosphatase PhoX [Flexithrix dorotheae]|uniref:alkaline phosphatase PhoX n=1 Tax=Flexithrix dorotheae TaxID=70993 RepID=UPI00036E8131|nr:alkaline phosphatase PhoX [Flexithrix dorotheae]